MHHAIATELQRIEQDEDVRLLFACESGSRAWGFESTDSDWDVRFVYLRRPEWYLSIDIGTRRDVIERPIDDELDVSGWDLPKALRLFRKSNPPLYEWLGSPMVYARDATFVDALADLRPTFHQPKRAAYHYARMATNHWKQYFGGDRVRHKRYFYALRPLLAVLWIESGRGVVPTPFDDLAGALIDDAAVRAELDALLVRKRAGGEKAEGPRLPHLDRFMTSHLPRLEAIAAETPVEPRGDSDVLDDLFRRTLERVWGRPPRGTTS